MDRVTLSCPAFNKGLGDLNSALILTWTASNIELSHLLRSRPWLSDPPASDYRRVPLYLVDLVLGSTEEPCACTVPNELHPYSPQDDLLRRRRRMFRKVCSEPRAEDVS